MDAVYSLRRERAALLDRMTRTFTDAAKQRPLRQRHIPGPRGGEIEWVLHEREVMLTEVNQARAERGLPPVDAAVVERAEQHACGHIDYATKWPLYCAEIVLDLPPWIRPPAGVEYREDP